MHHASEVAIGMFDSEQARLRAGSQHCLHENNTSTDPTYLQPNYTVVFNFNGRGMAVIMYPSSGINKKLSLPIPNITSASKSLPAKLKLSSAHKRNGYNVANISTNLLDKVLQDQQKEDDHDDACSICSTKEEKTKVTQ